MKKVYKGFLLGILLIGLCGCAKSDFKKGIKELNSLKDYKVVETDGSSVYTHEFTKNTYIKNMTMFGAESITKETYKNGIVTKDVDGEKTTDEIKEEDFNKKHSLGKVLLENANENFMDVVYDNVGKFSIENGTCIIDSLKFTFSDDILNNRIYLGMYDNAKLKALVNSPLVVNNIKITLEGKKITSIEYDTLSIKNSLSYIEDSNFDVKGNYKHKDFKFD